LGAEHAVRNLRKASASTPGLPRVQGGLWALAARRNGEVVGCAIVGHPAREWMEEMKTLAVLRAKGNRSTHASAVSGAHEAMMANIGTSYEERRIAAGIERWIGGQK
jgi:hypothetical protein